MERNLTSGKLPSCGVYQTPETARCPRRGETPVWRLCGCPTLCRSFPRTHGKRKCQALSV